MKRIAVATLVCLIPGALCATLMFRGHVLQFSVAALLWVLLNRMLMGFVIGASALRIHWAWNGLLMGFLVGSVFSFSLYLMVHPGAAIWMNVVVNALFGLFIEFCTTVVFKQRARGEREMARAAAA